MMLFQNSLYLIFSHFLDEFPETDDSANQHHEDSNDRNDSSNHDSLLSGFNKLECSRLQEFLHHLFDIHRDELRISQHQQRPDKLETIIGQDQAEKKRFWF